MLNLGQCLGNVAPGNAKLGSLSIGSVGPRHDNARGKAGDQFLNALNALASAELVQNHLNVDVAGNISQQWISAFGVQSPDTSLNNPNENEHLVQVHACSTGGTVLLESAD